MKKIIAVLLVAVLMLSFLACGVKKEELVGTWEVTSAKVDNGDQLIGTIMTFDENDHYSWKMGNYTLMQGEYKISGSFVYLDDQKEIFSISGDTLTVTDASGSMTLDRK